MTEELETSPIDRGVERWLVVAVMCFGIHRREPGGADFGVHHLLCLCGFAKKTEIGELNKNHPSLCERSIFQISD